MKAKQSAPTLAGQMVRLLALFNLWLAIVVALSAQAAALDSSDAAPIRIVAFGDSLTAGYRLKPSEAFPVQLAAALKAKGYNVDVANAGVSGDTTAAGLARLDWSVPDGTEAVILELGANDALRGIAPNVTRTNLDAIVKKLRERKIEVLVAGMKAPKNLGDDYERQFEPIFVDLAEQYGALRYPFFLDGVVLDAKLNLDDGMHPTGEGVGVIVSRILPTVEQLIERVRAKRPVLATP
ncbi:arylesterase [Hyphomicrobium sp.]|jgi:acyl-CoA thioesterase-1|uniref:arylesterase n=1 Tax=Hyphomicrobium sp. TaxID=82 RepID=UPI0025BED3EB|nr:arylesterase [Hyphomicrobium sp.]